MFCMWHKISHDSLLITHSWDLYTLVYTNLQQPCHVCVRDTKSILKKTKNKQGRDVTKIDFLHHHSFSFPMIR